MPPARRTPTQERSRRTVERIVDAAQAVLAQDGYDRASTNRIAAAAGVSPGTLYGYFADKDAIVLAVIDRVVDGFADGVAPALRRAAVLEPGQGTRMVLDAVLAELESRAGLLAAFVDRVPAERYAPRVDALRDRVSDVAFQLVAAGTPGADPEVVERAVWLAVRTIETLTVRFVLAGGPMPREAFLDDLTRMVVALTP